MRKTFIDTLCTLAAADERIVLLTGDLGFMVMEPFQTRFPDRFFNVGVAEQNMIGVATGMAEAGFIPFCYSIATFASLRPFEFIRNGPVLHRVPVRIVGMGAGFDYGHGGPSHHAVEDIGVLRTLPGLTVVVPADSAQTGTALIATRQLRGPVYFSLGKDDRPSLQGLRGRFEPGRAHIVRSGDDLVIVTMGAIAHEAVAAAETLAARGLEACIVVVSCFNPDPDQDLLKILRSFRVAISVEAQTISGGLAAYVGTLIARYDLHCRLIPRAVCSTPDGTTGSAADRWRKYGIDQASIVRVAAESVSTT